MEIENDDNENERPPVDNIHSSEDEETQPLLENVSRLVCITLKYTLKKNAIYKETEWT